MLANLDKKNEPTMYYYCDDNSNTYGPFTKEQLLTKITKSTLVYHEGINWTNAENVKELKSHFVNQVDYKAPYNEGATIQSYEQGSTKKYFSAPFSFDGRIRRMEYGISLIIYVFIYSLIFKQIDNNSFFSLVFIPLFWFIVAQGAKRCHDRGNSGWYQIIPFYALWMLFAEGDQHDNEYGSSPK